MLGQGRFLFRDTRTFSKLPTQICSGMSYRSKELASGLSWPRERGWTGRARGDPGAGGGSSPRQGVGRARSSVLRRANNGLL